MPNQVTLTFGGDTKSLQKAFDDTGGSAKKMGDDVAESANGFEQLGGKADNAERATIGVHDVIDGTATIMQGPGKQGIVAYLQGWADLAGGIAPLAEMLAQTKVATLAQAAAGKVAGAASKVWAAGQFVLNSAFLTSPLTWIILAIVALIGVIVLIATKTDWFQKGWRAAWGWIKKAAADTWDFLKKIPGWIGSAFSKVAEFIVAPYRFAFNQIAKLWNNTVGGLSFTVPGWVPVIGGKSFSVPNIPTFDSGGVVPGMFGTPVPILAMGGERVVSSRGGRSVMVSAGDAITDALFQAIKARVVADGGDPSSIGLVIR